MTCKERLTIKYDGNFVPKACCTINRYGEADDCSSCDEICEEVVKNYNGKDTACNDCPIQKCFNRLAELENKLEDCTLIELPCKVGDYVFALYDEANKYIGYQIEDIHIDSVTISFYATAYDDLFGEYLDEKQFNISNIGKTVFLTKEAAEAKLKELLNDN